MHYSIVSSKDIWGCRHSACLSKIAVMPYNLELFKTDILIELVALHEIRDKYTSS